MPGFDLPALAGLPAPGGGALPGLSDKDLVGRGVTIVNVWASWCGPCQVEHPVLEQLASEPGMRLVGINYKDKPEAAARFLQTLRQSLPGGRPGREAARRSTGASAGVPETFVIAADGTIRHKQVGPLTPESLDGFRQAVEAAAGP